MRIGKAVIICVIGFIVGAVGFFGGYLTFSQIGNDVEKIQAESLKDISYINVKNNMIKNDDENNKEETPLKITPLTKVIYKYYNDKDGSIETVENYAPYFLIDKTEDEVNSSFESWNIEQFNENTVIMSRHISDISDECFIIGEHEGFVAVFYDSLSGKIKEITDTPVAALPIEEQELLSTGVTVYGENELLKLLADYES